MANLYKPVFLMVFGAEIIRQKAFFGKYRLSGGQKKDSWGFKVGPVVRRYPVKEVW